MAAKKETGQANSVMQGVCFVWKQKETAGNNRRHLMGDKKGKKDKAKEKRQAEVKGAKAETQRHDRQQARVPGAA